MRDTGFHIKTKKEKKNRRHCLTIEGNIGINEISKVKSRVESVSYEGDEVVIDLNKVDTIDLSSVQLFFALKRTLSQDGKSLKIKCTKAEPVIDQLTRTGFRDLLGK